MDSSFLAEFRNTLEYASERLLEIPEAETEVARADGWCAKQVLGHLIDSAANNHARFVRAQLQDELVIEKYDQEGWVRVQKYEQQAWVMLVDLWTNYNLHLLYIISSIPDEALYKRRVKHSAGDVAPQNETLDFLVHDYFEHMQGHLKQILTSSKPV